MSLWSARPVSVSLSLPSLPPLFFHDTSSSSWNTGFFLPQGLCTCYALYPEYCFLVLLGSLLFILWSHDFAGHFLPLHGIPFQRPALFFPKADTICFYICIWVDGFIRGWLPLLLMKPSQGQGLCLSCSLVYSQLWHPAVEFHLTQMKSTPCQECALSENLTPPPATLQPPLQHVTCHCGWRRVNIFL